MSTISDEREGLSLETKVALVTAQHLLKSSIPTKACLFPFDVRCDVSIECDDIHISQHVIPPCWLACCLRRRYVLYETNEVEGMFSLV